MIDEETGLVIEKLQEHIRLIYLVILLLLGSQVFSIPQALPNDSYFYFIGKNLFLIVLFVMALILLRDNHDLNKRVKAYLFSIKKEEQT
jgi:hypothetical protein